MDPNATLAEIRRFIAGIRDSEDPSLYWATDMGAHLAAKVDALDEWLSKGGFLPTAWERK